MSMATSNTPVDADNFELESASVNQSCSIFSNEMTSSSDGNEFTQDDFEKAICMCVVCGILPISISGEPIFSIMVQAIANSPELDPNFVRRALCLFVLGCALPLSICKKLIFKQMMCIVNPQCKTILDALDLCTLMKDALRICADKRKIVMEELAKAPGRISFTFDNWEDGRQDEFLPFTFDNWEADKQEKYLCRQYTCITAHWIDASWELQRRVISFGTLLYPLDGLSIAEEVSSCLTGWKVDNKVKTLTLGNPCYDETVITSLKTRFLANRSLLSNGDFFQIRGFCYIMSLAVEDGIKLIDDIVQKVRGVAIHIQCDITKRKNFYEIADNHFHLNTKKRLRPENGYRWDLTYTMLDHALYFRPVLDHLGQNDEELKFCELSAEEWDKLAVVLKFLNVFYGVTNRFFSSKQPTSYTYFRGIWEIQMKLQLLEAANGPHDFMVDMVKETKENFDQYWLDHNLILSLATILDPRCKLELAEYCYVKLFGELYAKEMVQNVKTTLFNLFDEYKSLGVVSSSTIGTFASGSRRDDLDGFLEDYELFLSKKQKHDAGRSQLDVYLEEKILDLHSELDILSYWRDVSGRYPDLGSMARDILTIPIFAVPPEGAFAMGKRLIKRWQKDAIVEDKAIFICCQDWMHVKGLCSGNFFNVDCQ
ncbi:hypothetical protein HS088_TW03G00881 [Tripterygium wilfordii]|uniref:Zinc finger BED domain-containing protein RICESLEEPER 2-like n=1 Tax=Tripterygium wilfordii TaxID=458696 RepID=A0A7J7DW69_TRIWF|nr:hypothetical protein HS088_TW03G00881 [Tripterygium wilfordii]